MRSLPFVSGRIAKEMEGTVLSLQESFNKGLDNFAYYQALPKEGLSEVRDRLKLCGFFRQAFAENTVPSSFSEKI